MIDLMLVNEGVATEGEEEADYPELQLAGKEITNLDLKHSLLQRLASRKPTP